MFACRYIKLFPCLWAYNKEMAITSFPTRNKIA